MDPRSISTKDGIVTAKVRVTYLEPIKMPAGPVSAVHTTAMFDCAKKSVAVKESVFYGDEAKGTIVERRAPKQPGFGPVFRSNFSGVALDHLCAPPVPPAPATPKAAAPAPSKRPAARQ